MRVSVRSPQVWSPSRLAAVLTLVSVSVGGLPDSASAAPGDQLWVTSYNAPANDVDEANAVVVSPDASKVFVTGYSKGSTSRYDYATVAYDAPTGAELWAKRFNGRANKSDVASAVGVSPDGSEVFVTGYSKGSTGDYATVAYDGSTGAELWVKRYNGSANGFDAAYALGVSPDGSAVFVTGYSGRLGGLTSLNYATLAYNASTGAELWVKRYNGPANSLDHAYALAASPDGSAVFVTGYSYGLTSEQDYATVAYDASTGAELWVRRYNGPGNSHDKASALGVSPDGSKVFVTGYSKGSSSGADYGTVAYEATTGVQVWVRRYNGPISGADYANALGVSPDGSEVFVTGQSPGSTSEFDYATVAYDASTGVYRWAKRYNGPGNADDVAKAVGVSSDASEIFVTGRSEGSTSRADYATVAYVASTGAKLWLERYNGPAHRTDYANALGVSPDGSEVFVTGFSAGATNGWDYATVAYSVA